MDHEKNIRLFEMIRDYKNFLQIHLKIIFVMFDRHNNYVYNYNIYYDIIIIIIEVKKLKSIC